MKTVTNIFNKKLEIVETYKGANIVLDIEPVSHNICDHDGNSLDGDFYYISTESYAKVSLGLKNISTQAGRYVHRTKSDIAKGIEYVKEAIDKEIEYQIEKQRIRIATHRDSKITTYILNNVTINVLQYGDKLEIYANERPLRHPYLPKNFTLTDVLLNMHTRVIANYNVGKFSDIKTNYYKNRETHTIDMDFLPLYEFLGECIKIKDTICFPQNIRTSGRDNSISIVLAGNELLDVSIEDISKIEFATADVSPALMGMKKLVGLQNKLQFLE